MMGYFFTGILKIVKSDDVVDCYFGFQVCLLRLDVKDNAS